MTVWIQNQYDNLPIEGYRKQRFWLMSEAFAAAGHEVVFWTSDFSHATKRARRLKDGSVSASAIAAGQGLRVRFVKTLPYGKNVCWARIRSHRAYAQELRRQMIADGGRPDVIISSVPSISAAGAAFEVARELGARFVLDVMDAWPETFERLAPRGLGWTVRLLLSPFRRRVRRLYREADVVTGVCERYRELTGRSDYHLAYHGIETAGAAPVRREPPDGRIRLVYAGNLGRSYDLTTVTEGVTLLRSEGLDVTLDVAGFGGTVEAREGVRFHGLLGQDALRALFATCDIGVIPMRADSWVGLPYKLCDYAVAGLRIVSSLGGESESLLTKYGCGTAYRAGDAASFAAAVRAARRLPQGGAERIVGDVLDAAKIYRAYVARIG